jgi:hypothetical protein
MNWIVVLVVAVAVIAAVSLGVFYYWYSGETQCGCEWKITNCCPETAGARWECVHAHDFEEPECSEDSVCPQFISPMPTTGCTCVEGECVA